MKLRKCCECGVVLLDVNRSELQPELRCRECYKGFSERIAAMVGEPSSAAEPAPQQPKQDAQADAAELTEDQLELLRLWNEAGLRLVKVARFTLKQLAGTANRVAAAMEARR